MSCKTQRNPVTNRCVLSDGAIGKSIIGRPRRCDTVLNTKTNRCVLRKNVEQKKKSTKSRKKKSVKSKKRNSGKKSGKADKKSGEKSKKRVRMNVTKNAIDCLHVPKTFEDLANRCVCNDTWLRRTKIGSGAFGKVYRACKYKDCNYVVKVQKNDVYANAELGAYLSLQKSRLLPKLYAAWTCKGKMYLVLERLFDCTLPKTQLIRRLSEKLNKLLQLGWLHCDIHPGNVMCTQRNRLVLIDFGLSVQKGHHPFKNQKGKTFERLKARQEKQLQSLSTSL